MGRMCMRRVVAYTTVAVIAVLAAWQLIEAPRQVPTSVVIDAADGLSTREYGPTHQYSGRPLTPVPFAPDEPECWQFVGRVVDGVSGQAIAGVEIWPCRRVAQTLTSADWNNTDFVFRLPSGATAHAVGLSLIASDPTDIGAVGVPTICSIPDAVVDEARAVTDRDGLFAVTLMRGTTLLRLSRKGYVTATVTANAVWHEGSERVTDFPLFEGVTLEGQLRDEAGAAIPDRTIAFCSTANGQVWSVVTNSDGRFQATVGARETVIPRLLSTDMHLKWPVLAVNCATDGPLNLTAVSSWVMKVVDSRTGKPVNRFGYSLVNLISGAVWCERDVVDNDGQVELLGDDSRVHASLRERFELSVVADGYELFSRTLEPSPEPSPIIVGLIAGDVPTICGSLLDHGRPVEGQVGLVRAGAGQVASDLVECKGNFRTRVGPSGEFRLVAPPGDYFVCVSVREASVIVPAHVPTAGLSIDLSKWGGIKLNVSGWDPSMRGRLGCLVADSRTGRSHELWGETTMISGLVPGPYELSIRERISQRSVTSDPIHVQVVAGAITEAVVHVTRPDQPSGSRAVRITVDGSSPRGLWRSRCAFGGSNWVAVSHDGAVMHQVVTPTTIEVIAPSDEKWRVKIPPGSGEYLVTLTDSDGPVIVLVTSDGAPLGGVVVKAIGADVSVETTTDAAGTASIKALDVTRLSVSGGSMHTTVTAICTFSESLGPGRHKLYVPDWTRAPRWPASVFGSVLGAGGRRVHAAEVSARIVSTGPGGHRWEVWSSEWRTQADDSGRFNIPVPPFSGELAITVRSGGVVAVENRMVDAHHGLSESIDVVLGQ